MNKCRGFILLWVFPFFVFASILNSQQVSNQRYAIILFEENLGKFSTESIVKNTISNDLLSKNLDILETSEIPLKSIRMEKVYFFDSGGQKVYKSASLTANVSSSGMEVNSDYQMNVFPVLNIEDIIWELDYEKARDLARRSNATRLIAGKIITNSINIDSDANLMGMCSVNGQIYLRLINLSDNKVLASYSDSLTKMGASNETASLEVIKALSAKAVYAIQNKLI
jgi:hypothetical protein